jgi:hypothetical protein
MPTFEFGMPSPGRILTVSGVTLGASMRRARPSSDCTVVLKPQIASCRVMRHCNSKTQRIHCQRIRSYNTPVAWYYKLHTS